MSYPIDPEDVPTSELQTQLQEIISRRMDRANSGKCAYCGQDLNDPNHGCKYAANPDSFHPGHTTTQGKLFP